MLGCGAKRVGPGKANQRILAETVPKQVAETLAELEQMLDRVRVSPALRQEASNIMLRIGQALSVAELVNDYERSLCYLLDGSTKA